MKLYKFLGILILCILLFSLGSVTRADDPPKSTEAFQAVVTPAPTPAKGSLEPIPLRPAAEFLDRSKASVTYIQPPAEDKSSNAVAPNFTEPNPYAGVGFMNRNAPTSDQNFNLLEQPISQNIGASTSTIIMTEGFEGAFPGGVWTQLDKTGMGYLWDKVPCFAMAGSGAAWPANDGILDPCSGDPYPDNMDSWLIYGPFDLSDAQSASLDFYFRLESESGFDFLRMLASTNDADYYGFEISGTVNGPSFDTISASFGNNDYSFMSFDLTNVPTLGDLTGQPLVWIAFQFESDVDTHYAGPFIDRILLRKNSSPRIPVTDENFDVASFPNANWQSFSFSATDARWDDIFQSNVVNCPAQSNFWSMWPAYGGNDAVDPCQGGFYPNNMNSWLIHGPFSLVGAEEAWVDFYYRLQGDGSDRFYWMVATDDIDYWGFYTTLDSIDGPFNNGYNLIRFNLRNVPTLGDLTVADRVWLAFIFTSNGLNTNQGPFLDDVSIVVERANVNNQLYLPITMKALIQQTNLSIQNNTTGAATYTIKNPKLNGAPIADITCNIPKGQKVFCGTFDTGTYHVMSSSPCGTGEGSRTFPPGNYDLDPPLHCL